MNLMDVINLLQRAGAAGIELYGLWQKANASIRADGSVDAEAYVALVNEADSLVAALRHDADEARRP